MHVDTATNSGRWKPGESGNPAGRKPGTGHVAALRAAIAEYVPQIIDKLVESALAGDVASARLLLERAIPPLKAVEEAAALTLPDGSLTEAGCEVMRAVGSENLSPTQGVALLSSLASLGKLKETDELTRRIEALEQGLLRVRE